jgi:Holliday junction resolvase RusA-like endonuclease
MRRISKMARKKKETVQEPVVETVEPVIEEKVKTTETPVLQVVTYNEVYLRAKPLLDNTNKNLVDKMIKGKIYDVTSVINFSIRKMYRLKEGYYVIADEVKIV